MIRLFTSKPVIKHSNNKAIITVYVYNRKRSYFLNKIRKTIKLVTNKFNFKNSSSFESSYLNKELTGVTSVKTKSKKKKLLLKRKKKILLNTIKNKYINTIMLYLNKSGPNLLGKDKNMYNCKLLAKKESKNSITYKYYSYMLYYNSYIFNAYNLLAIKNILTNIYQKKIVLNIVNLKYLFLDSNILAEAITRKLKDRNKRVLRVLKLALKLIKQPFFKIHLHKDIIKIHYLL
jgi:hypothetical protein